MLVIRGQRVVLPDGERPASVHIQNGTIAAVAAYRDFPPGADLVDAGDLVISPGIVDTHVHVNEPGRTEWEGFDTATRAAAAGVVPGNQSQLDGLIDAGVRGFKCFLVPSGVDEFPAVAEVDLRRALPTLE